VWRESNQRGAEANLNELLVKLVAVALRKQRGRGPSTCENRSLTGFARSWNHFQMLASAWIGSLALVGESSPLEWSHGRATTPPTPTESWSAPLPRNNQRTPGAPKRPRQGHDGEPASASKATEDRHDTPLDGGCHGPLEQCHDGACRQRAQHRRNKGPDQRDGELLLRRRRNRKQTGADSNEAERNGLGDIVEPLPAAQQQPACGHTDAQLGVQPSQMCRFSVEVLNDEHGKESERG